ncbi:MAG: MerC domain-containing protein [Bacteroidota bacterium]
MLKIYTKEKDQKSYSDMLGMGSAMLCLIHCLAAPVLMGLGVNLSQIESSFFLQEFWEYIFLSLGFIAVYFSSKHSPTLLIKILLWGTFLALAASIFLHEISPVFEYLVYIASLALIITHLYNFRRLFRS